MAEPVEHFLPGSVVRVKPDLNMGPDVLWVVVDEVLRGYRIFMLGGSMRYFTGVSGASLIRVTEIESWTTT